VDTWLTNAEAQAEIERLRTIERASRAVLERFDRTVREHVHLSIGSLDNHEMRTLRLLLDLSFVPPLPGIPADEYVERRNGGGS
jgi:hypothetical protein